MNGQLYLTALCRQALPTVYLAASVSFLRDGKGRLSNYGAAQQRHALVDKFSRINNPVHIRGKRLSRMYYTRPAHRLSQTNIGQPYCTVPERSHFA